MFSCLKKWFPVISLDQQSQPFLRVPRDGTHRMAPKLSGSNSSDLMILCVQWCNQCRMAGTGTCTTAGSHTEYCVPPTNYRQPPNVSCLVFVVITVNVLRTPNERRVGGRARFLSGVWPQKILWGWPSSRPKTSFHKGCA